jgi:cardiolipin synthase
MHRKIAVIDNMVGYTGSMNIAHPRTFKCDAGVGPWVDAMVRVRGPVVFELALTFLQDWAVQTGEHVSWPKPAERDGLECAGEAAVQVLATGPLGNVEAIERIVLTALYEAGREILMTTPYFIPSESMLSALVSAARRGVAVTLIVPARVDSRLVHYASRSHQSDLLAAGVRVAQFRDGLLHTKSITVDGRQSLFGSLNLDPRSMRLDFEITLAVHDAAFTGELRRLQESYLARSDDLSLKDCLARGFLEKLAENTTRLLGPVL